MILKRMNVEKVVTDSAEIARLKAEGYLPVSDEPEDVTVCETKALHDMTVKELRTLAEVRGYKLSSALKKQDIIDILEEADDRGAESRANSEAENPDSED